MKRILVVLLFVFALGCGRNQTKNTTATQPEKPSGAQVQQPTSRESYDPSHDRIWTSMVPGLIYTRDSSSGTGMVDLLQRHDDARIAVPAPAAGTVKAVKNHEDHIALSFSDASQDKFYHYRLSEVAVVAGQKVKKDETLGFRPGVVRIAIGITAPDGKRKDPRKSYPSFTELPADADKF